MYYVHVLLREGSKILQDPPPSPKCRSLHAYEYVNTCNTLYDTIKFIHENIDDLKNVLGIFLEIKKAFDSVYFTKKIVLKWYLHDILYMNNKCGYQFHVSIYYSMYCIYSLNSINCTTNNNYSVVLSIWLTYNDGNLMCTWPTKKSTNISNLVKMYKGITKDFSYHLFYFANNIFYGKYIIYNNNLI